MRKENRTKNELLQEIERYRQEISSLKRSMSKPGLDSIINDMDFSVTIQDRDFNIIFQNSAAERMFGGLGEKCYRIYEGQDRICNACPMEMAFKDGKPHTSKRKVEMPSGDVAYWEISVYPVRDTEGDIYSCVEVCRNITENQKREEDLYMFKGLINLSNDAIFVIEPETSYILYVNDMACQTLGYTRDELLAMKVLDIETLLPDNFSWKKHVEDVLENSSLILEGRHKCKDGSTFPVEVSVRHIVINDTEYMVALARDITRRKNAETVLKKERDQFMNILENMVDGIYIVSPEHEIEYINPVIRKEFGNVHGRKCYEYFHGRSEACPWCRNQEVFEGKSIKREFHAEDRNKFFELFDMPIRKSDGTVSKFEIFHDITERKRAEGALRQSEERYRTLIETTPHGIQESDTSGIITFSNTALCRLLGYTKEEMVGKAVWDFFRTGDEQRSLRQYIELMVNEQFSPIPFIGENVTKDGRVIDLQIDWNYKRDADGNMTGFISVITDITERLRAEEAKERLQAQLLHSQKMEAIGRLAGGIAHDFGNILTAIKNFSSLGMKRTGESDPASHVLFEHIRTAAFRGMNLTKQLLTFSHKEFTRIANVDLNDITINLLDMLNHIIGEDVRIITRLGSGLFTIRGDSGKLEQVITNLVVNARDAMPRGGEITIMTENTEIDDESTREIPYSRPGKFIRLTVSDTGTGISEENIHHIFEPFFTTKKNGSSSGLGLSVVYGIVKDHAGWINVSSSEEKWTTFEIYLPALKDGARNNAEQKEPDRNLTCSGERILLVEDEDLVRTSARMSLIEEGYLVFEAESSEEALRIFQSEKGNFDLVISDLVLPDKNGMELIKELQSLNPGLKAILNSGHADKSFDSSEIEKTGIRFFGKPYDMRDILLCIREMLAK